GRIGGWLAAGPRGGRREGSGAEHADGAVIQGQSAQVVEVGAERGDVVEHRAVLDRQRPRSTVEDAAACGPGGVAGQGALLQRGRGEVVDGAARIAGSVVAGEGAAADIQRCEVRNRIVDGAALGGRVAGERAATDRQRAEVIVDGAAEFRGV